MCAYLQRFSALMYEYNHTYPIMQRHTCIYKQGYKLYLYQGICICTYTSLITYAYIALVCLELYILHSIYKDFTVSVERNKEYTHIHYTSIHTYAIHTDPYTYIHIHVFTHTADTSSNERVMFLLTLSFTELARLHAAVACRARPSAPLMVCACVCATRVCVCVCATRVCVCVCATRVCEVYVYVYVLRV